MRSDVEVRLGPGDRERLEAVLADRNSAQKHVWRARIILATAEGCGTMEIMRRAGVSKPCVWRWQRRFMEAGVASVPPSARFLQKNHPSGSNLTLGTRDSQRR